MKRYFTALHEYSAVYLGLGLLAGICLLWLPIAVLLYPALPRDTGGRFGRYMIMNGFRIYLRGLSLLRACRFDLTALDALRGQPPMIIAPNHPCLLDAVMVISRLPNVACIMKATLMDNILLGAGARLAGYVRNDTIIGTVMQSVELLQRGCHILVFPEGTRTTRNPTNALTGSFSLIANRAHVPVQTVLIETDSAYLSKGWPLFRKPSLPIIYRVRLGQRFDPPVHTKKLVSELERYFAAEFKDHAPCPKVTLVESNTERMP